MILNTLALIASLATPVGVCIAAWQIRQSKELAKSSFENQLSKEYRKIIRKIPVDALIGNPINDKNNELREIIYNYLDLCNEQTYLRKKKRISDDCWEDWKEGIKANLSKPAFQEVWDEIKAKAPKTFTALELLEQSDFKIDPAI